MTPSTRKKGIVTSLGVLTAVATLLSGGVTTAYANDALANPNSAMGYPSFKGAADPIPGTGVAFDPSTSYLSRCSMRMLPTVPEPTPHTTSGSTRC